MRPRRLELAGFTSFKEPTEIDFDGSDFFALVGATGSGKSSVIDAICFALYGSVPRYDNRNLVAPVISHGKVEAKVLLDFTIDGKEFTAVRVVRRSGKGASTKEARLESGGESLAATADEVTEAVTNLIGLTFEHFTRCVVLPQGEFARFLHDKPSERQNLVVKLLNLGIYERMAKAATVRASQRKFELERAAARLTEDLQFATPESLQSAKGRVKRLEDLRKRVKAAKPKLDAVEAAAAEAHAKAAESERLVKLVTELRVPSGIDELGERIDAARKTMAGLEKKVAVARTSVEKAVAARDGLPERSPLSTALAAHDRRAKVVGRVDPARAAAKAAEKAHAAATKDLEAAEAEVLAADAAKVEIERADAAAHVAQHLVTGEPCPVCLQPVDAIPNRPELPGMKEAESRLQKARANEAKSRKQLQSAATGETRARSELELLEEQLLDLEKELASYPDPKAVRSQLEAIDKADAAVAKARSQEDQVRKEHDRARKEAEALQAKEAKERSRFESARDRVAALGPPAAKRDNLAMDWLGLAEWALERAEVLARDAEVATAAVKKAEDERAELIDQLVSDCTECEVEVARDDDPLEAVLEAQADAKREVDEIAAAIEQAKTLRREMKTLEIEQKTAEELALHLSARSGRFESWLVNAALRRLVEGATEILTELSDGQYALTTDDQGAFQVVDRHNANETRSAKTLSGGETFLASLALALALADQLADLASDGAASLEAIFLDEGFGTLDPETLDTVAATVANLAEGGRMVGIVTHVRELAEQVPVQFRVKKDPRSSTVERVVAS